MRTLAITNTAFSSSLSLLVYHFVRLLCFIYLLCAFNFAPTAHTHTQIEKRREEKRIEPSPKIEFVLLLSHRLLFLLLFSLSLQLPLLVVVVLVVIVVVVAVVVAAFLVAF